MSEQSEEQALERGHECAMAALATQRGKIAALSPADRLYWWLGFLTAALGAAFASIGEPAARALRAALAENRESRSITVRRRHVGHEIVVGETYITEDASLTKKKA